MIDKNSGLDFSVFAGGVQSDADAPARQLAVDRCNNIVTISKADAEANWKPLVESIYAAWVAYMQSKGIDCQALIDEVCALMAEYTAAH